MSIIKLVIDSEIYKCSFSFERRLTVIKGDSGVGKSTMAEIIAQGPQPDIKLESTYPAVVVTYGTWEAVIRTYQNRIIIFDDLEIVATQLFASICKNYVIQNNLYIVIIARECLGNRQLGMLSYSVNSIFDMVADGINHYLKPSYIDLNGIFKDSYDLCLVEDKTACFDFFNKILAINVMSAEGKGKVTNKIIQIDTDKKFRNILLLVDTSAFGCHIEKLFTVAETLDVTVTVALEYESFEEFLLQTNMLNDHILVKQELSNLPEFANQFFSWETYFEYLIATVTKQQFYRHTHSSSTIGHCYTESCIECNPYIAEKCDKFTEQNKISWLLNDTKYENLLALCKKDDEKEIKAETICAQRK